MFLQGSDVQAALLTHKWFHCTDPQLVSTELRCAVQLYTALPAETEVERGRALALLPMVMTKLLGGKLIVGQRAVCLSIECTNH